MSRRLRLKNPSAGTTLLFGGLLAAGTWYYFREKGKKTKAKQLKAKKGPRNVEMLDDLDASALKPPFVVLGYCETDVGRAILDAYIEESRKGVAVPVYAIDIQKEDPTWDCEAVPAMLAGMRIKGAWRETVSGEGQDSFVLTAPDSDRLRIVMNWASGTGDLPLESATYEGKSDLWSEWGAPPVPLDIDVGTAYFLPVNPPDPKSEVQLTNSNEGVVEAYTFIRDFEKPSAQQMVGIIATQKAPGVMISAIQGDWKKQLLVRPRE